MKPYACLGVLALAACRVVANPGVCCTTDEDCARLGVSLHRGCPDGFVCRDLLCEAEACAVAADCPIEQPVCDPDSASCTGCTGNADCDRYADAPVCDPAAGGCRACSLDAECASDVCDIDTGRCVAEGDVIYASPGGTDTARCSHEQPCSLNRAIVVATADPSSSIVRLLPGTYGTPIAVSSGTVTFVGTGALLHAPSDVFGVAVRDTAIVEIRGLEIDRSLGVDASGTGALFPALTLRQVSTKSTIRANHAILKLQRSIVEHFELGFIQSDATLDVDRTRFGSSSGVGLLRTLGDRMRVRITNSVFERALLTMGNGDTAPDRSEYYVLFNTFLLDGSVQQNCESYPTHPLISVFENNIFFSLSPMITSVLFGSSNCTIAGSITYPQDPDLGGTNIDQDPRFVSLQGKDYRLQPGSPAVDAAVLTTGPELDHDFAGTPRPQGGRKDIGAFELRP